MYSRVTTSCSAERVLPPVLPLGVFVAGAWCAQSRRGRRSRRRQREATREAGNRQQGFEGIEQHDGRTMGDFEESCRARPRCEDRWRGCVTSNRANPKPLHLYSCSRTCREDVWVPGGFCSAICMPCSPFCTSVCPPGHGSRFPARFGRPLQAGYHARPSPPPPALRAALDGLLLAPRSVRAAPRPHARIQQQRLDIPLRKVMRVCPAGASDAGDVRP